MSIGTGMYPPNHRDPCHGTRNGIATISEIKSRATSILTVAVTYGPMGTHIMQKLRVLRELVCRIFVCSLINC